MGKLTKNEKFIKALKAIKGPWTLIAYLFHKHAKGSLGMVAFIELCIIIFLLLTYTGFLDFVFKKFIN